MNKPQCIRYIFPGFWNSGSYLFVNVITSLIPTIILAEQLISGQPPNLALYITLLYNALPQARLFLDLAINKKDVILGRLFRFERAIGITTSMTIIAYCLAFILLKEDLLASFIKIAIVPRIIQIINIIIGCVLNVPLVISSVEFFCQLYESKKQRDAWQKAAIENYKLQVVAGSKASEI